MKKKSIPIHYITSKNGAGQECWHVLICPYAKLRAMLSGKKLVKPEDYGYVVAYGFSKSPPEDIRKMLIDDFGFEIRNTDI